MKRRLRRGRRGRSGAEQAACVHPDNTLAEAPANTSPSVDLMCIKLDKLSHPSNHSLSRDLLRPFVLHQTRRVEFLPADTRGDNKLNLSLSEAVYHTSGKGFTQDETSTGTLAAVI
ncbi:hypothetical protein O3P69_008090 [Scylla paramamosain]|uniref:Uncharacterized protein n=1 Tax=Scylla paramamosain TaxID=85552 RepID=A0AAW0SZR7_SCYPA